MTREEKLANDLYYYIHNYVESMSASGNNRKVSDASRALDRALISALRSRKK